MDSAPMQDPETHNRSTTRPGARQLLSRLWSVHESVSSMARHTFPEVGLDNSARLSLSDCQPLANLGSPSL